MILFLWYGVLIVLFIYFSKSREGFPGGVRYIRIGNEKQPWANYIQIGEIKAFNINNTNVALGKPTTSSGQWQGWTQRHLPSYGVDNNPNTSFHTAHPPKRTDFWEVDLGKEHTLSRIEYHNRADCCQDRSIGCTMTLLDKNKKRIHKFEFTTDRQVQTFYLFSNGKPPSVIRDKNRWL